MELLKQIRIAVVGIPDCGKSTLVKGIVKVLAKRELPIDVLMNEIHYTDGKDIYGNDDSRTIKAAKVFFKYKDVEFCLYDCPGHLEYLEQIKQGLDSASLVVKIIDLNREKESKVYFKNPLFSLEKPHIIVKSHATNVGVDSYNILNEPEHFNFFAKELVESIYSMNLPLIDVEQEAKDLIRTTLPSYNKVGMFFSGGKDSLVGLELLSQCGIDNMEVLFPYSGYDFPEVLSMIKKYQELYNITITPFFNSGGYKPHEISIFEWMKQKAHANDEIIKSKNLDVVCVQYRASDEGVRAKDYHIVKRKEHYRFSPVFYFSETNIWRFIQKYNLPVCVLYFKGYRSLGDNFCTEPCMPNFDRIEDIIRYIDSHPEKEERGGRTKQDNSSNNTMERLRDEGFF